jgi:hypothetical protein
MDRMNPELFGFSTLTLLSPAAPSAVFPASLLLSPAASEMSTRVALRRSV